MRVDRLQLFVSVAKHLSFTQASRESRITQPAVSRQIKLLQEEFGIILFMKKGRGVELTEAGREFLKAVKSILSQVEDLKKATVAQGTGSLSIAACRGPCAVILPYLMARFREVHPFVNLTLYSGNSAQIRPWLRDLTVDLGIITSPPSSPSFYVEPYRREPLIAFMSPNHPFAEKRLRANDRALIPLIVRASGPLKTRTEKEIFAFRSKFIKLMIAMRCGSTQAVKQAVAHGAGVGILYEDAVKRDIDRGEFKPVVIPGLSFERRSYIVYSKERPCSALAQEFLALLREAKTETYPFNRSYFKIRKHVSETPRLSESRAIGRQSTGTALNQPVGGSLPETRHENPRSNALCQSRYF